MSSREDSSNAESEPCFVISIAARLVKVHQQTLRYYERLGLLDPSRSQGNIRIYSMRDIQRAQQIRRFIDELGVNLAGVEVILNMTDRMNEIEQRMAQMQQLYEAEIARLRALLNKKD